MSHFAGARSRSGAAGAAAVVLPLIIGGATGHIQSGVMAIAGIAMSLLMNL